MLKITSMLQKFKVVAQRKATSIHNERKRLRCFRKCFRYQTTFWTKK